ncbi:methylmalonyl-CoA epimerase [Variovorax sp. PBS-H4]|uniref:VOC family protein n=1 Tax=Variovorax sp. PBS-H4 TaxID=434008 RepID=UPI001315E053|nr:VOC family protein [Variovorax sp. PBS-H4]VTU29889.1 methylmalonyl-CoA epimerase [Variovorax sp. PBS-H4]
MSALFGPVRQLGYVVRDLEAAMKYWVEVMRVGPFFHFERAPLLDYRYRGTPQDLWISAALAQCGSMQIELIQPRNEAPSMWKDFLHAGHEGLQHIAFWVDETHYDAKLAQAQEAGFRVCMSASTVDASGRLVYFEQEAHPGTVVELSCMTPSKKKVFDAVAEAAVGWDGKDPIRRLD